MPAAIRNARENACVAARRTCSVSAERQLVVRGPVGGRGVLRAERRPQVGQAVPRRAQALVDRVAQPQLGLEREPRVEHERRPRALGGGLLGEQVGREDRRQDQRGRRPRRRAAPRSSSRRGSPASPTPARASRVSPGSVSARPAPISAWGRSVQPMEADGTSASAARPPAIRITPAAAQAGRIRGRPGERPPSRAPRPGSRSAPRRPQAGRGPIPARARGRAGRAPP